MKTFANGWKTASEWEHRRPPPRKCIFLFRIRRIILFLSCQIGFIMVNPFNSSRQLRDWIFSSFIQLTPTFRKWGRIKFVYMNTFVCIFVVTLLPSCGRYGIMLACWQGEPKERPPFPALVQILGDLLQDNSLPVSPPGDGTFYFESMDVISLFRRMGKSTTPWINPRVLKMMASRRPHRAPHRRRNWDWLAILCQRGTPETVFQLLANLKTFRSDTSDSRNVICAHICQILHN